MTTRSAVSLAACLFLLAPVLAAPEPQAPPTPKPVTLTAKNEPAAKFLQRLREASGELILPDSTVEGDVTGEWKDAKVGDVLTDVTKALKLSWKRLYLPPGTGMTGDNVSQVYRSLQALRTSGLVALDPDGQRGTILLLNASLPKDYTTTMEQPNSGFRRAYLVLNEKVPLVPKVPEGAVQAWKPGDRLTPENYTKLSNEMLAALAQLPPEEREAVLRQAMEAQTRLMAQNPQLMAQMIREGAMMQFRFMTENPELTQMIVQTAMQAQLEALQSMTPEQLQAFAQMQADIIRQIPPEQLEQFARIMGGAAGQGR